MISEGVLNYPCLLRWFAVKDLEQPYCGLPEPRRLSHPRLASYQYLRRGVGGLAGAGRTDCH